MAFPYDLQVLIAFTTPPLSGTPSWVDVTDYAMTFSPNRGREDELAVIQPGECELMLDNSDGRFNPDYTLGPYYGYLRPNRRLRIIAQATALTLPVAVWDGYVDSWTPSWPEGADHSIATVTATDRFKWLKKRGYTESRPAEDAEARMTAILENGGVPDEIIQAAYRSINPGGTASRNLVAYDYDDVNALQAVQDVSLSDGGAMFMDAWGVFTFQPTTYRTSETVSTVSQATFGNTATAIPVLNDLTPTVDDDLMANIVTVTCGAGVDGVGTDGTYRVAYAEDTAYSDPATGDGPLVLDIGNTLLAPADGPDRCADVLALRKDPRPRYPSVTIDPSTNADAMVQALDREISDRVTIAFVPPGAAQGASRDQFIEAIRHDVNVMDRTWRTTFTVSGATGGATVIYP